MKKFVALTVVTVLCLSTLVGCGDKDKDKKESKKDQQETVSETTEEKEIAFDKADIKDTVDVLANIHNKYAAGSYESENDYNDAIYNVDSEHIFTFDCNENAVRNIAYDAFAVYTTTDFENTTNYVRNCANSSLENGKIVVRPAVVDVLYDIPDSTITADTNIYGAWKTTSDGTWGSLNKLYLVQKYDLETGNKLDKPIITPFTVYHDIESTTLKQKIDENNNYYLEWTPVSGAESYLVYQIEGTSFTLVDKTTDTKVSADSFKGQLRSDKWSDIVNKELAENGYDVTTTEKMYMNSDLHNKNANFAVVVVKNGRTSGVSNIVNPDELADLLPYCVANHNLEVNIQSINDMPTYVEMETVNGKTMQMLINYHGCSTKYEDDNSTTYYLLPSVYHTDLSPFLITIHSTMPYSQFKEQAQQLGVRQDKITATLPTEKVETEINVANVPNKEEEEKQAEKIEEGIKLQKYEPRHTTEEPAEPTVAPTTEPVAEPTTEPTSVEEPTQTTLEEPTGSEPITTTATGEMDEIMQEVAAQVGNNLSIIQSQSQVNIDDVIFANSPMEEWMAYCLMARSEFIPVPTSEFPEANDVEGAAKKLYAVYRQNPTSGVMADLGYSYDYQTFVIQYADDTMDRLNKTVEELAKAKEVANNVTGGLSSDYDKVVALNDYFCENASYDESSMSTDVDMNALTQPFIDAHTPYGILCNNYGVCESYSEAMVLSGRLAGLDVITEVGNLYGAGGHEWNRVKIDGNWCILDITNNDNELAPNALCNITDSMAAQILIADNEAYTFNASATTEDYEYYRRNNNYANSLDELKSKLKSQLDSKNSAAVRCNSSISQDDVIRVAQQLYSEGYNLSDGYYVYNIAVLTK